MTYEEVKGLLEDVRNKKRLCLRLQKEINTLLGTFVALGRPAGYTSAPQSIRQPSNRHLIGSLERLDGRLEGKRKQFESSLTDMMDTEDELTVAIGALSSVEQDVIIGYYLQDLTHYQLARECNYSERSTKYIKKQAITKLSKLL